MVAGLYLEISLGKCVVFYVSMLSRESYKYISPLVILFFYSL